MATSITTIAAGDLITDSRAVINDNFSSLNTNKIETSYIDTDTTLAANSDSKIATQKAVKAYVDAGGNVNASTTAKGVVEEATDAEVVARTTTGSTGARLFINPGSLTSLVKFGGTGADGALAITSGTTTLDLGAASTFTKNYTSISITGTAKLAFSNPGTNGTIIILKSQGAVTITSSTSPAIDASAMGAAGATTAGSPGESNIGLVALGGTSTAGNNAGVGGVAPYLTNKLLGFVTVKNVMIGTGAGGAQGSYSASWYSGGAGGSSLINSGAGAVQGSGTNGATPGTAGRGGGAVYLECAGAYNVTSTVSVAGGAGGAATGGGGGENPTGGGGGGGGTWISRYNTLTADSGTYTVAGGAGGAGGGTGSTGGAGGDGFASRSANVDFL